jgi:hypothetical protein
MKKYGEKAEFHGFSLGMQCPITDILYTERVNSLFLSNRLYRRNL